LPRRSAGLGTPVGTPPNLIGIGFVRREAGVALPFFSWMALGVPVVLLLQAFATVMLWRGGAAGRAVAGIGELIARERQASARGPWAR
jgi:sodium-dependent dicarboxylate transporter 2/3/5